MPKKFTITDAVKCAQRYAYEAHGSICGGCHFDTRCGIHAMLRERRENEREEYMSLLNISELSARITSPNH